MHSKPPLPYRPKWKFTVQEHIPPEPTPMFEGCRIAGADKGLAELDAQQRCLQNPPLPGIFGTATLTLQVERILQVGETENAQLFTVSLCETPSTQTRLLPFPSTGLVLAKVFDPLYADETEGFDAFLTMDQSYTHETRAYQMLSDLQGRQIPRYYGSYSLSIPLSPNVHSNRQASSNRIQQTDLSSPKLQTREVRMILMEYIDGKPMSAISPTLPQTIRQLILRQIVDLESQLYEKNIALEDVAPRNVMIVGLDQQLPQIQVIFIDFAESLLERYPDDEPLTKDMENLLGQYISPLLRWRSESSLIEEFEEWIAWDWDLWLESEFAHTSDMITPAMQDYWPGRQKWLDSRRILV